MISLEEKKRIVEKYIGRELVQYFAQHQRGLPMKMLSAKYARSLMELGGFQDFIEGMRIKGLIAIEYKVGGARLVLPCVPTQSIPVKAEDDWY